MKTSQHSFWLFLPVSMFGSFSSALLCVIFSSLFLPPTDLAYHQGILKTLGDPFVRDIALFVAFWCGLLATPLLYFCLRRRRLRIALPIVFASVYVTVMVTSAVASVFGLFCGALALIVSCIFCLQSSLTRIDSSHDAT
jgi:hypothetical protein